MPSPRQRTGPPRFAAKLLPLALLGALLGTAAWAHVGSPDVYVKANAGPYALLVSVHPPATLPGAAEVDVRADDSPGLAVEIDAVEVSVAGSTQAAEPLRRFGASAPGGQSFTGSVWTAEPGAWRVRIHVAGSQGEAETSVPVPAAQPGSQSQSSRGGIAVLAGLSIAAGIAAGLLLGIGHGRLRVASGCVAASLLLLVALGWARTGRTPNPPRMQVSLASSGKLSLTLSGRTDDLVPDHNHLMHLFALRQPEMDVLLHLHPAELSPGHFEAQLPSMPPGAFTLYADIVHADGTPDTFVANAGLPLQTGQPLQGDDAFGVVPGVHRADPNAASIQLADGYRMTFDGPTVLHPRSGELLRFSLLEPTGKPPADMELYMGMVAHAAIVKADGTVFAHIHPAGNIPMAAYGMNMAGTAMSETGPAMSETGPAMSETGPAMSETGPAMSETGPASEMGSAMSAAPSNQVAFPFGFPSAGQYRIFVEMKHGTTIETGAFDVAVQ